MNKKILTYIMDPSDLLLTNSYNEGDICKKIEPSLEHLNNIKEKREHLELKEYLQSELNISYNRQFDKKEKYDDEYDTSFDVLDPPIRNPDITANLERPQWIYDKKNISLSNSVQPVFDKTINNLKETRYRKKISSYINIDSRQRNIKKYPNPGNYNIFLNKEFRYLQSIKLESIEFREAPTPINERNNCFKWITNYTGLDGIMEGTRVEYQAKIPSSFYSLSNFVQIIETTALDITQHEIPEEYITSPAGKDINNKFPNFNIYIDPFNRSIEFIQRLENLIISKISTCKNSNVVTIHIKNPGSFKNEHPPNNNCNIDSTGYPFKPHLENVPIILSGLELFTTGIGNIPTSLINLVPFYPKGFANNNQHVECSYNTYSCPNISYDTKTNEFIYNLNVFTCDGKPACASVTTELELEVSKIPNYPAGHPIIVKIGRSLKFEVVTTCGGTFGEFLGLTTANQEVFINRNFDIETRVVKNRIPWKITGTGELSIATEEYIFMRIGTKAKPIGTISDNLTCAKGNSDTSGVFNKKDNFFFAKIIFSDKLPGDISILSTGGKKFFYNAPLVTLSDLTVDFFDFTGKPLELYQNHSFTLEIIELREVLKDTLLDSRTGNIADVGTN